MSRIAELRAIIGSAEMRNLVEAFGGLSIYIPRPENVSGRHALTRTLGRTVAVTLAEHFGGASLNVPLDAAGAVASRHKAIREAHARGATPRAIAREHHLSVRHVWRILASE